MFASILNRPWKVSVEQGQAILNTELSRRKVLFRGSMVSAGVMLAAFAGMGSTCNLNLATLAPAIVDYVTNISGALLTSLASITNLAGLPAGWSATLATITSLVTTIKSIAGGITTSTLISTANGDITAIVTDFNQIVNSIVANPVIAALVSGTGFGWALSLASILLPLVEQAVQVVINLVVPPTPAPLAPPVAAHRLMTARMATTMDPATANEILRAIAAGKM